MKIKFVCPECGSDHLEELMVNVEQSSHVTDVVPTGTQNVMVTSHYKPLEYHDLRGGVIQSYGCGECDWHIPNMSNLLEMPAVATPLYHWLVEQGMLE